MYRVPKNGSAPEKSGSTKIHTREHTQACFRKRPQKLFLAWSTKKSFRLNLTEMF